MALQVEIAFVLRWGKPDKEEDAAEKKEESWTKAGPIDERMRFEAQGSEALQRRRDLCLPTAVHMPRDGAR